MGPANLDDVPEFLRLRFKRALQLFQRRDETVLQLFRGADMDHGRDHVVARLAHVDVIVRMNVLARSNRFARKLRAPVGDDFVRVRVRARAGAGLKNVERSEEHTSELQSRGHLVCRLLLEKKKKKNRKEI